MKKYPRGFLDFVCLHLRQVLTVARLTHFDLIVQSSKTRYAADIRVDYAYLRAYIRFGDEPIEQWRRKDKEGIVQTICHEVAHIIVGIPMNEVEDREDYTKQEEQATEMVGRLLCRVYTQEIGGKL